jgi:hypothetical protein
MSDSCIVLVAEAHVLPALGQRFSGDRPLLGFSENDALAALQAILTRRPELVVLERVFATTPRGTALISRIKADPSLEAVEIRVVSHDSSYVRTVRRARAGRAPGQAAPREAAPKLDPTGTRRAPRYRMREGQEAKVDGNPVALLDLSTLGAQVRSAAVLRPNQRVQIAFGDASGSIACRAVIAWASYERPEKGAEPCYRAGLQFLDAPAEVVDAFRRRNAV